MDEQDKVTGTEEVMPETDGEEVVKPVDGEAPAMPVDGVEETPEA